MKVKYVQFTSKHYVERLKKDEINLTLNKLYKPIHSVKVEYMENGYYECVGILSIIEDDNGKRIACSNCNYEDDLEFEGVVYFAHDYINVTYLVDEPEIIEKAKNEMKVLNQQIYDVIEKAEKHANRFGIDFSVEVAYGAGATYEGDKQRWYSSSQSC